jgi:hypothetical protein
MRHVNLMGVIIMQALPLNIILSCVPRVTSIQYCVLSNYLFIIAGWSSLVARQAHNLKVVGSNPAPATSYSIQNF